jgi:hypothetical protein
MIELLQLFRPQAGDVVVLRGYRPLQRVKYTGSRYCRIEELDGSNSRLCQKRDLSPAPLPQVPEPIKDTSISALDREFTTWDHK